MREVMHIAIEQLQKEFLSAEEVAASHAVMGLDSQLVEDGTYFVVEDNGVLAGCGGWSRRATLYGGDHSAELRDPRLLNPATEPARVRAMYSHPRFVRRGVGRMILEAAEQAARECVRGLFCRSVRHARRRGGRSNDPPRSLRSLR